jgi:CelD/BcsL family acetyltransferase involved in cellulose biosynthesis
MPDTISIKTETIDELIKYYRPGENDLRWPHVFVLPGWLSAWWEVFGVGYEPLVLVCRQGVRLIGIAPFKRLQETASFIGDASVCDYLDFIITPGYEEEFAGVVLNHLAAQGIRALEMATLRPESVAFSVFQPAAAARGWKVSCQEADVSYETTLPDTIEAYLELLNSKQRYELERKQRNFDKSGQVRFTVFKNGEAGESEQELFFSLMAQSRMDKAVFLTEKMKVFFRRIFTAMAADGLLRLGFVELDDRKVAAVLFFEYKNRMYLYNSGYDPAYASLSVGVISKLWSIRWAIENKINIYDFLKGPEPYKARMGGQMVSLAGCRIALV